MEAVALAPEDRAILDLESATVAGHTCKVIVLGEPAPELTSLRGLVAGRIASTPALTRRLADTSTSPVWVPDEQFDLTRHVTAAAGDPIEPSALPGLVAELFAQHLDRARPLWRLDRVAFSGGGAALVWRVHHALADATTALRFARALLWDQHGADQPPHRPAPPADDARRRQHLVGFLEREFTRSREHSPFDGHIGTHRRVAFTRVPLDGLHRAAKDLCGATVNDAVLSTVAGGLRHWILRHHGHLGNIRVKVPVSLHHEGDDAGNRDSFFTVDVPLTDPDPVSRLSATRRATAIRKADHDAVTMDDLLHHLAGISPALERLCGRIVRSPRRFAVNVSNTPGPREPVSVLHSPVEALHTIAEIGEHHALRVSVISFGGTLSFGLCADPAIVEDVESISDGIAAEARALVGAR